MAGEVETFLHRIKQILKVAKDMDTYTAIKVISFSIKRLDFDVLVQMPDTEGLSLPCFNELCLSPTEDGLRALVDSLKNDIKQLYRMAGVPGCQ